MQEPIYVQIHNQIKQTIAESKWHVGQRIPSERALAKKFNVSRMTMRQAIQTLVDEGILQRKVGSGTYIASQKVQEKMSGTTSFTDIMLSQGKKPSSKLVSYYFAESSLSEQEQLQIDSPFSVLRMERIRLADNIPICFDITSVPADIVTGISRDEIVKSLYHALEKHGYQLGHAFQTVSAMLSSEKVSELLQIKKGTPILRLRQITMLSDGRPFEYVRSQYVGDRFEFYLER
ncbi:MAG: GntR family transcriptional regulator [Lactobacillus sp.]|jgi:GntR family transcriptional regulator|uniref:GntR family transcriptional regulator n=1 Tax=Bombilactobacillus bombi TaxID=1303590 RepID=A0A347SSC5_9LACO|nr:GntR family transcriptional regulator [Bombilactobacillus bombi]MCO6541573.1 GntR family transcriptional regulator [Lactobacillus sp.]AXX64934.1 GntR family transcriptional regulator [Bombilactobacillus bombi]MCO6543153.1 GntR family transcriptional regulator [Lactobacillus sp.]RHW45138.1 GntR family transcriptional regulator [Bombilactobacillus bombi]RHW50253.1 GntR family transcriptional regulator [Bombilactobacillus bombi]